MFFRAEADEVPLIYCDGKFSLFGKIKINSIEQRKFIGEEKSLACEKVSAENSNVRNDFAHFMTSNDCFIHIWLAYWNDSNWDSVSIIYINFVFVRYCKSRAFPVMNEVSSV